MLSVRVWNLQSDGDAKAVRFLENEFLRFRQLEYLAIRTTAKSALRKCHRKGTPITDSLRKTIQHYLKQDDYIIFVIDSDQRGQLESKLLVEQIRRVVKDGVLLIKSFSHRIFKNVMTLYQHSGSASFRVSAPKLKVSANGFGKNGIGP